MVSSKLLVKLMMQAYFSKYMDGTIYHNIWVFCVDCSNFRPVLFAAYQFRKQWHMPHEVAFLITLKRDLTILLCIPLFHSVGGCDGLLSSSWH